MGFKRCPNCNEKNNQSLPQCWKCGSIFKAEVLTESQKSEAQLKDALENFTASFLRAVFIRIGMAVIFALLLVDSRVKHIGYFFSFFIALPAILIADIVLVMKTYRLMDILKQRKLSSWDPGIVLIIQVVTGLILSLVGTSIVALSVWFKAKSAISKK